MTFSMINTQSGKDFTYGAKKTIDDEFEQLFYFIMQSAEAINTMRDQDKITIEISKIRSKLRRLIIKYFHQPATQLSFSQMYKDEGKNILNHLNKFITTFEL